MAKKEKETKVSGDTKKSLKDRILKNSTIAETSLLSESMFFHAKDKIPTAVPIVNCALGGDFSGGLSPGLLMIAGPSKHFKTGFGLLAVSAFLQKYPDGIILFYDSEFGSPESYFASYGIPSSSVIHSPITDIEMLKHDIMVQLKDLTREDKILIIVDSIGNLASIKEIADAIAGNQVADMTRAKALKSLWRMVTPHLTIKDIPLIAINHTYKTQEMYSKDVVSGGTGGIYNANDIWIIGRQQGEKDKANTLLGYNFTINVDKSRFVREKSKFNVTITYESGIHRYSGLWDLAEAWGYIKPSRVPGKSQGFVLIDGGDEPIAKEALENNSQFFEKLIANPEFSAYVREKFQLPQDGMMLQAPDSIDVETGEIMEDADA